MSSLTTVERIGNFANNARLSHLSEASKALFRRNILDSLGCAIAALPGAPFAALRDQFHEYRGTQRGSCTLIGGGHAAPDEAALYNSGLVRYVDLLDSYMSPGGLCHPSDNFGAILAASEHASASGAEFMLALAVAYEIESRITAVVPVMAKGFNHAIQLAASAAAGAGKLFGLSAEQIAHAVAIATVDNVSLTCVHSEPVSQWKGFSPGITGMRAVYAASLAKRGFTGPLRLFEGPNGLERMFDQPVDIDWESPALDVVQQTVMKKYCSLIHGQPVLEATLALRKQHGICAEEVEAVQCDIFQMGYDIAGGGSFGAKDRPMTKEQADYNLKYLIAAALLDGQVGPAQLETQRIQAADAQALLGRVTVAPDATCSSQYPNELNTRVTITLKSGRVYSKEHVGFEGSIENPLTWERTVEKFNWLSEQYAGDSLREEIVELVTKLETHSVKELMQLMSRVSPEAKFPARHPGIQ
ncbi:MmgE/PrpD family protein [Paraburkholderia sp. Tr-20389]|uniref:MmgE/PrpD family protein n=1 Tax=Paraburkholderia sp. Tr-20389 TaxID=2703903 RepID=UPI00197D2DED|nr:MmgE/PrpD family protein [Paraburkholderia sp. Tr-20389]MBN3751345.1 MmgE/PrpD family protein [Paraburkholderia sp. Tr-20389]